MRPRTKRRRAQRIKFSATHNASLRSAIHGFVARLAIVWARMRVLLVILRSDVMLVAASKTAQVATFLGAAHVSTLTMIRCTAELQTPAKRLQVTFALAAKCAVKVHAQKVAIRHPSYFAQASVSSLHPIISSVVQLPIAPAKMRARPATTAKFVSEASAKKPAHLSKSSAAIHALIRRRTATIVVQAPTARAQTLA